MSPKGQGAADRARRRRVQRQLLAASMLAGGFPPRHARPPPPATCSVPPSANCRCSRLIDLAAHSDDTSRVHPQEQTTNQGERFRVTGPPRLLLARGPLPFPEIG